MEQDKQLSPGQYLRARREDMQLSINEVTQRLRLHRKITDALEQDDYEALPTAYIKGHLRAYARLLGLEGDDVIQRFAAHIAQSHPTTTVHPKPKRHRQTRKYSTPIKMTAYLVSLTLVILALAWYRSHYTVKIASPPHPDNTVVIQATPSTGDPEQEMGTAKPKVLSHVSPPEYEALPQENSELLAPTDMARQAEAIQIKNGEIRLILNAYSWIEVIDADTKTLFFELAKPGDDIILSGQAPFIVRLGYAPGVELFYQGKLFDTTPYHTRENIALFTLGETSSPR